MSPNGGTLPPPHDPPEVYDSVDQVPKELAIQRFTNFWMEFTLNFSKEIDSYHQEYEIMADSAFMVEVLDDIRDRIVATICTGEGIGT